MIFSVCVKNIISDINWNKFNETENSAMRYKYIYNLELSSIKKLIKVKNAIKIMQVA